MSRSFSSAARRGLTLIELVVVIAILGVLAAMLLPKFEGLQGIAGHTATASSAADLAKIISATKASRLVYPDGYDSLLSADNSGLWAGTAGTGGNAGTSVKGLHNELVDSSNAKLSTLSLSSTAQVNGFTKAGINTIYGLGTITNTTGARPGDAYTVQTPLSATSTVAIVNPNTSGGLKIINHVYRSNLATNTTGTSVSSGLPSNTQLVVFGLGPQSSLVTNGTILEAPVYSNANAAYVYNRLLVVFEMKNTTGTISDGSGGTTTGVTATTVKFKGVLGADGDLLDDMSVNAQTATSL